ncbi:hypothetical protein [Pseudoalteromonas sp. GB56]
MGKGHLRAFALSLILLLFMPAWASSSVWKIASLEWPPYASEKMENGGEAIAQLRALLETKGIALEVNYLPWEQAQSLAAMGEYMGYYPAWPSEIKPGFIASQPLSFSPLGLITLQKNTIEYRNLVHLFEQYKIGVVSSYVYPDSIQSVLNEYHSTILYAPTEQALVAMLNRGSVDLILATPAVVNHVATKQQSKQLRMITQFADVPLVLALKNTDINQANLVKLNDLIQGPSTHLDGFKKPQYLTGTYIQTPGIDPFIKLIKKSYADIGIDVKLEPVPARRGLVLLNAGLTDLDVVRLGANMAQFGNVTVVEPNLASGEHVLLCDKGVPCELSVLSNTNASILTARGTLESLAQFDIQAKIIINEQLDRAPQLLKRRDVEYAIISIVKGESRHYREEFNVLTLRSFRLNHVINNKFDPLIPELHRAITANLAGFTPSELMKATKPESLEK